MAVVEARVATRTMAVAVAVADAVSVVAATDNFSSFHSLQCQ